jgi:immune inhibitor A
MKGRTVSHYGARRARKLHLVLNLSLVLLMLLAAFGTAAAQAPAPVTERTAVDPYDQWTDEFLDFVPPNPETLDLAQPDGATVQANLTPAETGAQIETPDGYTIVKDAEGWWSYAQLDSEGKLAPSALKVGKDVPAGIEKKLGQTPSRWLDADGNDKRDAVFEAVKNVQSPNASIFEATPADLAALATKNYHYVVVLAEFTDVKFEPYQTPQYFKDQISGLGISPTGTVSDLYYEMSYGQFLPDFEVIGPFTLPHNMYWYDYQLSGQGSHSVAGMITDLAPQLSALGGNWWDGFDNDRVVSGTGSNSYRSVDMVVVLHAGPDKSATGQAGQVWSHATTANLNTGIASSDNRQVRIRGVNTVPAIGFNIGVVAHEMGHTIGEPDYYDTSYRSMGTGDWDLMAGGSWMGNAPAGSNPSTFNPFSRINQGWIVPQTIESSTYGLSLRPRTVAPDVVMIPLGGSGSSTTGALERLYIEHVSNRAPQTIFDKAEYNSGLLIWHYDAGGSQTKPTTSAARYRMGLVEYDFRDGTNELALNLNRGEPTDPWSDTPLGITPYTTPSTDRNTPLNSTRKTGWYIMNISAIGETMTLDVVKEADVQHKLGVDRPALINQPVIARTGPATLSTKVYNLAGADLSNVKVEFWGTMGAQQVKLAETTLATLPAGAPTVATATWAAPIAGKFDIRASASVDGATAETPGMARVFARPAKVLLVDDDDGYTAEQAFEGALNALGVPHVVVEKTAPLSLLQQHELVIWSAGQAGRAEGQLTKTEVADLKAYLDAGGKAWFSSPRLACAVGSAPTATVPGVDVAFTRDYLGASYTMSNQAGGGTITGLGQYIGGNASYELRGFPGRAIEDFIDPVASTIGTATPLFTWSYGHNLGTEVIGDAAHNNFHVVFFGFNMSQVISGADRLSLTQQVLDRMGIATVYFDKATYLLNESTAVRVAVQDADLVLPASVKVTSAAQPAGIDVALVATDVPGRYTGVFNMQKPNSKGNSLKVNEKDTLKAVYVDAPDHNVWGSAAVLTKVDKDLPAVIYHDLIDNAIDAQPLPVLAVVTDDIAVQQVVLYYRVAGTGSYTKLVLPQTAFQAYSAIVPAAAVTRSGLEYYVTARDSKGNVTSTGTAAAPNFVVVQPRTIGMP